MKRFLSIILLAGIVACGVFALTTPASADEIKLVGVITRIDIAGKDATTATATLKDNKTEQLVIITVNDELTLDKFKDHRIVEGDEIRTKYDKQDGKNISKMFKKTAGC